jgi:DNA-binding winged helix-turn-helix (wHTH) protein
MEAPFRLGDWLVQPQLNRILTADGEIQLQPKAMEVLVYLARRPAEVVTKDQLFRDVWAGVFVTDEALTYVIWELRKALTDDAKQPRFIQTVSKKGYRLIAPVSFDDVTNVTPRERGSPSRRYSMARGAFFGLILAAGIITWWFAQRPGVSDSNTPLGEREWVIISRFENRTGESVWDGALEYLLEGEILRSRSVNVVPRERVGDVLRLMKRPVDTAFDPALAQEIALRDGAIGAILAGRIEKREEVYSLTLRVIDPANGATVSMASVDARGRDQIGQAVRELSDRVRRALGEDLAIGEVNPPVPKVTTHSLAAFRLFSQGMLFVDQKKWHSAIDLLGRAVAEDPDFASAHIYLAHSYSNLEMDGQAASHYEKAFALADTLSDRERYFIIGSYYSYREATNAPLRLTRSSWNSIRITGGVLTTSRLTTFAWDEL